MFNQKKANFLSLDLGTANSLAYVSGQGVIYNEPSVMAYDVRTNKLIAVGSAAYEMVGKTHSNIRMVTPLVDGVISDLGATTDLLRYIFDRIRLTNVWKNSIVLLACPSGVTELERAALRKVASEMGASHVLVEEEVKMAAIGAGINIHLPVGNLVLDIGGGTTDIAVIASGDIIVSGSIKVAGRYIDEEIQKYLRSEQNVVIGEKTAEEIKCEIGSLIKFPNEKKTEKYGRDIVSGLPKRILVNPEEIRNVMLHVFSKVIDLTINVLESAPPGLAGDIIKNGITICGGGALIKGIDKYFESIFEFPVRISNDPLMSVINGTKSFEKKLTDTLARAIIEENQNDNEFQVSQKRNRRFG
ncbi:rod shape-determining protein [Spiroplasma endosymbiont of Eupeodes luniger]|uniref:rod shape-determining protein n=1 Tax=Spiroplasma endosymbiont of Eupeodes luniger TaxID=3066300 RepID=UPI0030D254A3